MLSSSTLSEMMKKKLKLTRQNAKVFNTSVNLSILPKKNKSGRMGVLLLQFKKGDRS